MIQGTVFVLTHNTKPLATYKFERDAQRAMAGYIRSGYVKDRHLYDSVPHYISENQWAVTAVPYFNN